MREKVIEAAHVARVRAAGGESYKWTSPGCRGVPDRIDLYPGGRVEFTELKAPGKKLGPAQARMVERLRLLGFQVNVVDGSPPLPAPGD